MLMSWGAAVKQANLLEQRESSLKERARETGLRIAKEFEDVLAPDYHVALTGSALYGSRPGHTATYKDIDLIIYTGKAGWFDEMKLLMKLQSVGFKFERYGLVGKDYDKADDPFLLPLPRDKKPQEDRRIWVGKYDGMRVDLFLKN